MSANVLSLPTGRPGQILRWLASPHWMLAFFVFAGISAFVSMEHPEWITPVWAVPLLIFCISLGAAVATNPRLHSDLPLLGLHLGLLAMILLLAIARLSYLDGAVSLDRGAAFDGRLHAEERGPMHFGDLSRVRFANDGFEEVFRNGASWHLTSAQVRWWDDNGQDHTATIGDHRPLVLHGYHIYTTNRRGYTAVFHWQGDDGVEEIGSVQLRNGEYDQANEWKLGNGLAIWAMLQPEQSLRLNPGESRQSLGKHHFSHQLVIRHGTERAVLGAGDTLDLPGGRLTYKSLDSWMGYRLVFDPAMYWLSAAGAFSVLCMVIFYGRLFFRKR